MIRVKKKVLIVFPGDMELGGIERSLLGLLDVLDYEVYDVDFFLYGHHGALFPLINERVNLLPEVRELAYLRNSLKDKIRHGCWYSAWLRIRDELVSRHRAINFDQTWAQIMRHCAPELPETYDLALSFFLPFDFLIERVKTKKKIGWIHTDYTAERQNLEMLRGQYAKMDGIAAVSDSCKATFCKAFPEFENKVLIIENILPKAFVFQQAEDGCAAQEMESDGAIRLLSVGRFCTAKNFDNVPDICRRLRGIGLNVRWYLIGYGGDEPLIRRRIEEAGMQEHVVILGKKSNPYPYIKACDLYVQPSRYEGKCVTVREAQMLGKPVVITNYATAPSQLEDGADGVVVPMDNAGCAEGIAALLRDPQRMARLMQTCRERDYSNAGEVEKLYQLME